MSSLKEKDGKWKSLSSPYANIFPVHGLWRTYSANSALETDVQSLALAAGSAARSGLSTYSEAPPLTSYPNSTSIDQWHIPPDYLQKDVGISSLV